MDNSLSSPIQNNLRKLVYLLGAISVCSCIIRNDYNVIFSFLILIIVNKYFSDGPKYYAKIIFQLMVALVLVDVIWLIITMPYWNSDSVTHNDYWESLSTVHTIAIIMAFIELALKVIIAVILFFYYKNTFKESGELFNFHYDPQPERSEPQMK